MELSRRIPWSFVGRKLAAGCPSPCPAEPSETGGGARLTLQILTDQLTLSQPDRLCPPHNYSPPNPPSDFLTFLQSCPPEWGSLASFGHAHPRGRGWLETDCGHFRRCQFYTLCQKKLVSFFLPLTLLNFFFSLGLLFERKIDKACAPFSSLHLLAQRTLN